MPPKSNRQRLLAPARPHSNEGDFDASMNNAYKDLDLWGWVSWYVSFFGSRRGSNVSRPDTTLTEGFTLLVTMAFFCYEVLYRKIWQWFITFVTHVVHMVLPNCFPKWGDLELIEIAEFSNDVTQLTLYLLLCLMFVTLCYRCDFIHKNVWKRKTWFLPNMMAGGFAPRLIALSLGCLIFASGTCFKAEKVSGSKLREWPQNNWEVCRAISLEMPNHSCDWFSRFHRFPPAQRGYTCLGVDQFDLLGYSFKPHSFQEDFIRNLTSQHGDDIPGLVHPEHNLQRIMPGGAIPMYIVSWFHWFNPVDIEDKECMYQCFKWKEVSFLDFIKDIGTIAAGCSIVAKGTEYLTETLGSSRVLRMGLVTPCTEPKEFQKIFMNRFGSLARHERYMNANRVPRLWERSHWLCAAILTNLILVIPHIFASDLDMDGYYTQDFFVTQAFLASFFISLLVRIWSPFLCEPILYTKKMWTDGSDVFIKISEREDEVVRMQAINLYEWIHLSYEQRCSHLYKYARAVSASECEMGLNVKALDDFEHVDWAEVQGRAEPQRYVVKVASGAEGVVVKMTDQGKVMVRWTSRATCEPRGLAQPGDGQPGDFAVTRLENIMECSHDWKNVGLALGLLQEQAETRLETDPGQP